MALVLRSHAGPRDHSLVHGGHTYRFRGGACTVQDEAEARRVAAAHKHLTVEKPVERQRAVTQRGSSKPAPATDGPGEETA